MPKEEGEKVRETEDEEELDEENQFETQDNEATATGQQITLIFQHFLYFTRAAKFTGQSH